MDKISSLETKSFCSGKIEITKSQKIDSISNSKRNRNYRIFFRRKFQKNNLRKLPSSLPSSSSSSSLTSPSTSSSSLLSSLPSLLSLLKMRKNTKNYAVLVLTILLGLIQNSLSSPVFVDNPSIAQFQSGRNIRHLPCIVRKSGLSGTCMFAIDCIKQNGTHLGTCIDRFYFGSCCRIKDDYFAQDINDNSIDQNTISHFLNDINTTPSTIGSYKPTIQQDHRTQLKTKPTLPVSYVPISTVIPSMQNRENSVNSSFNEASETNNSLLNNSKIAILSSSQTSSVSVSSSSLSLSKIQQTSLPSSSLQNITEKPLNQSETLSTTIENFTTQSSLLPHSSSTSLISSPLTSLLLNYTIQKQTVPPPTKPINVSHKPTSTIQHTTSHKISSTHKISPPHTAANEVLKETAILSKITSTHPTKLTYTTKHIPTKQPIPLTTKFTVTMTSNITANTNKNTYPTKSSTFTKPILTTLISPPLVPDNHIKDTTESVKFTTFQVVETTTFIPTTTTSTFETKKPSTTSQKPTKTTLPIIYVSNKPLYTKRPFPTNRTKGTKRPTTTSTRPTNSIPSNASDQTTTTTIINTTSKKAITSTSKKPLIVTKRPLTTRPPISKSTPTTPTSTLTTTSTPYVLSSSTKRTDLYKTDASTTTKTPMTTVKIVTQSTKAPRPNPKPTADIVRIPYTTVKPHTDITAMKVTSPSPIHNFPKVNISSTTSKTDSLHSSITSHFSTTTKLPLTTFSTTSSSTVQAKTTTPLTTIKPLPSILTKKPVILTSSTSTSSFKQPTTKQPSSKPSSTRFPSTRPSIITNRPSQSTSTLTTTKSPLPTGNKSTSSPSRLPIITKHPLTTKPPISSTTSTTKSSTTSPFSSTVVQLQTTTTTTTMKPTGLVTWTNVDNVPENNISISFNTSNKNNEDWQPKPMPDWALKPSIELETNNTNNLGTPSSSPKPNAPTTEDIIASSITSVLDQLNNLTANNISHTTDSSWVWTTETKYNVSSTTLSSTVESLGNTTSNGTASTGDGLGNVTSSTVSPIPSLEGMDYKQICGKRMYPEPRIVGGANAAFGRWPWQISLRQWRTSTYLHKCGAALLNENWAITAAHCVDNVPPSDLLLRLGEYDLAEEEEPYSYQERRVQIVASHPQFDPRTFEYDLALLRFYEPVIFQPNIIPVCVPDNDYDFLGQTAYVTGWGRLYEDGPLPSVLQEVSVPVINNTICETMYRAAGYIEHIPHIFICAGWKKGGYDSCEGDSGGPMVLQRERDKRFVLGGVISWGIGCAEPNQPGVYTRISEFRDWINQILQF